VETVCRQVTPVKHLADSFSLDSHRVGGSHYPIASKSALRSQLVINSSLENYCQSGTVEGSLRDTHGEAQKLAYPCFAALGRTNIVRIPRS
jgi:hypothetical protein